MAKKRRTFQNKFPLNFLMAFLLILCSFFLAGASYVKRGFMLLVFLASVREFLNNPPSFESSSLHFWKAFFPIILVCGIYLTVVPMIPTTQNAVRRLWNNVASEFIAKKNQECWSDGMFLLSSAMVGTLGLFYWVTPIAGAINALIAGTIIVLVIGLKCARISLFSSWVRVFLFQHVLFCAYILIMCFEFVFLLNAIDSFYAIIVALVSGRIFYGHIGRVVGNDAQAQNLSK